VSRGPKSSGRRQTVPGSWIVTRATGDGGKRYLVRYRLGGRESAQRYAGSFRTRAEALERRRWLDGELAAMRVPDLSTLDRKPVRAPTLADAVAAYRASRIDIAEATRVNIGTSLNMIAGALNAARPLDAFAPQEIADAVARLHASGYKRETIRKAVTHLACVFDFAEVEPNPVRDRLRVRLPRGEVREPEPPSAEHVEAVYRLLPSKHRLALLWLDWSGARVSSIDTTTIGDYDEPRRRVRLRGAASKTGRALWVDLTDALAEAIERTLPPREDRDPEARLFASSGADAIRTSIAKACRAAGVPVWSPHDLRHRRISLLHRQGRTWAEIGALVGQRSLKVTSDTYTHVLVDSSESTARRCSRDRSRGPSGYVEVLAQLAIPKLALWEPPYVPEGGPRPPADAAATFATLVEEHRRGEAVEFFMAEVVGPPPEFVPAHAHNRSGPGRKRWRTRSPTTQRSWATTGCRRSASRVSRRRRWCWTVARARLGWA
jgi:integrase